MNIYNFNNNIRSKPLNYQMWYAIWARIPPWMASNRQFAPDRIPHIKIAIKYTFVTRQDSYALASKWFSLKQIR